MTCRMPLASVQVAARAACPCGRGGGADASRPPAPGSDMSSAAAVRTPPKGRRQSHLDRAMVSPPLFVVTGHGCATTAWPLPWAGDASVARARTGGQYSLAPLSTHLVPMAHNLPLLHVRRFFCDDDDCPRRTLAERLPDLAPVRPGASQE